MSKIQNTEGNIVNFMASAGFSISPADSDLTDVAQGLYVGGDGNVVIQGLDGNNYTLSSVPAGTFLPVNAKQVRAATTATNIIGFK